MIKISGILKILKTLSKSKCLVVIFKRTTNDTQVEDMRSKIANTDLKLNDFVVVIGEPNSQGQIEAKFIRVMPVGMPVPPPAMPAQ